ncbi:sialidase family protein [Brachybacterium epidermidis]|uniref:sialidase family protein n=1 Tax=Brachybacterium epidermidis TaxID=2781983 RepID=UPI00398E482B
MSRHPEDVPTVLARRGVGTHRQYRIPALTVVPADAAHGPVVLCSYDGRADLDDLPAPIDLLLRRSLDGGHTWEEPRPVRTGTGFAGFGDPSLLVDPSTGTVLLFHSAGERAGFFESGTGEDDDDPDLLHCDISVSHDAGRSWEHRRLSAALRRTGNEHLTSLPRSAGSAAPRIAGMFAASGTGCAITSGAHEGRLLQPYVLRIEGRIDVACAYSDDHGVNWRLGEPIAFAHRARTGEAGPDLNEASACALPDGSVLLHSRGTPHRLATVSRDGGKTFGPVTPVPDLGDPSVNGSVIALESEPGVLLASHCDDPELRRNLTVSRSDDEGRNWRAIHRIEPGAAAYSQLAELPDGRIGVVYEADGYQDILFTAVDLRGAALSDVSTEGVSSTDAAPPTTDEGHSATAPGWSRTVGADGVEVDLLLRSIVPARPEQWVESGPTHTIDLSDFKDVDPSVFKEIGQDREGSALQVLRTRESLQANLGPVRPGLHEGDELEIHARVRNTGSRAVAVHWDREQRRLAPGETWVRRDLRHRVGAEDVRSGAAIVPTEPSVEGRSRLAVLRIPTAPRPPR